MLYEVGVPTFISNKSSILEYVNILNGTTTSHLIRVRETLWAAAGFPVITVGLRKIDLLDWFERGANISRFGALTFAVSQCVAVNTEPTASRLPSGPGTNTRI